MVSGGLWERLATPERVRFVRFGVVGVSGIGVNLAFVAIGLWIFAGLDPQWRDSLASIVGIVVSIFTNFLLNDVWTWGDRNKRLGKAGFALRVAAYYVGAALAAGVQFLTFALLRHGMEANIYLAQLVGIALGMGVNYVVNNRWVFRDREH